MRKLFVLVGVALASLTLATGAMADPAMHSDPADDVFTDVNPCTGRNTEITYDYKTFVIREGADAAGGFHVTGTGVGTVTTADGFSGRFTLWFGFNESASGTWQETVTNSNTLTGGSGQRILVRSVFHATFANGELRVEHEFSTYKCVGKPA